MPSSPYDPIIGPLIKKARNDAGMSQDELANLMSIDGGFAWQQSTVAKVERGDRTLSAPELWFFCQHFTQGDLGALLPDIALRSARVEAQKAAGTLDAARKRGRARLDEWSPRADTTRNAARALATDIETIERAAQFEWGRSYLAERERRVNEQRRRARDAGRQVAEAELRRQVSRDMVLDLEDVIVQEEWRDSDEYAEGGQI
jgi:transcriptional regulator with XRE-family HTH domain